MYTYVCIYVCTYVLCIYIYIYQFQCTPLHVAAMAGQVKIVETLMEAKADLCAQDKVSALKENRQDADRGMR